jgi:uncharacterized oligopeptide transporter (OPT) family protein
MQHNCGTGDFINQPRRPMPHLTMCALVLSSVLARIAAAASAYLGLLAGMIASAVPYAVVSMAVPRTPVAASCNNIVQTHGSAGTSLVSRVDFNVPAPDILGYLRKTCDFCGVVGYFRLGREA